MPQQEQALLVDLAVSGLGSDQRELAVRVDRGVEVTERPVDRRPEGRLGQSGTDVGRDLGGGGAPVG